MNPRGAMKKDGDRSYFEICKGRVYPLRLDNLEDKTVSDVFIMTVLGGTQDSGEVQHCQLCTDKFATLTTHIYCQSFSF